MKRLLILFIPLTTLLFAKSSPPPLQEVPDQNPLKVLTPALKERKTAKVRLHNGLEVLLISDPQANKSAASLAVEVGSWHDPKDYPGMAHFCEHMLFMGSKKYPEEEGFFKQVTDSGGLPNAYTWTDRTVYAFSSGHKQFTEILDMFAHFFIDPLFNESAVKRELLAVNQEYAKNVENDQWREWQIIKETNNSEHPNANFSTGNAETLKGIPLETLANWYRLNYSADKMHLVVYSNEDLSLLKRAVHQSFSPVPTSNPPSIADVQVMSEQQKGAIYYIEPIRDLRCMTFVWELPSEVVQDRESRIPYIIAYTLAYKGEGSLFESLQKQGLVENLDANVLPLSQKQAFVEFSIDLTKKGIAKRKHVIEETFAMLRQLQQEGIPQTVIHEMQKMGEIRYQWQQRQDEFQFVMSTASGMVDEPLETYPYHTQVVQTIKPNGILRTLGQMTPNNTLITCVAPSSLTQEKPDRKEQWLGGEYKVVPLSQGDLDKLAHLSPHEQTNPPKPNPFIPDKLAVRYKESHPETIAPDLLLDDAFGRCYYMEDHHYLAPEIVMKFGIRTPAISSTPKSIAMSQLAVQLLERRMTLVSSEARRGGTHTNVSLEDLKLTLSIRGPADRAPLVMTQFAGGIKTLSPNRQEFETTREILLSNYENQRKSLAFFQARHMLNGILYNDEFTGQELAQALRSVTYEEYLVFTEELIQSGYVEGVINGNLSKSEALTHWLSLKSSINLTNYPTEDHQKPKVLTLERDNGPHTITQFSEMQGNSALLMIQVPANCISKIATQQILSQVLWASFFDTLRTKQQTGYITKAWSEVRDDQILLFFGVQSTTHYPQELLARFELYLEDFLRNLDQEMTKERFASLKENVIDNLSKPPTNLRSKNEQLYHLAFRRQEEFDRRQKVIEAVRSLDYAAFKEDVTVFVTRDNSRRLAILIEGKKSSDGALTYKPLSYAQAKAWEGAQG